MKLKRAFAFAACLALATAGCSLNVSANGISSDPNIDAQQVVDEFVAAEGDGPVPAYDRTYDMTLRMDFEQGREEVRVETEIQGQDSASGEMSNTEFHRDSYPLTEGLTGRAPEQVWQVIFSEKGDEWRVYASSRVRDVSWAQELMSADDARQLRDAQDYPTKVRSFVTDAQTVGVREEGGSYVVEIVPSEDAMEDLIRSGGGTLPRDVDVSLDSGSFTVTIDKNTHHLQGVDVDYNVELTAQAQDYESRVKVSLDGTFDDSQTVTVDLPDEAKAAPDGDVERRLENNS
ncbi:MAG: hypothetical protein Q3979_02665 [Actinomycetaceae bacterium]|nr:hypothetical protein [Actinomycetaceae bacterium]